MWIGCRKKQHFERKSILGEAYGENEGEVDLIDLIGSNQSTKKEIEERVARCLVSQAILLSISGLPGLTARSYFGINRPSDWLRSESWHDQGLALPVERLELERLLAHYRSAMSQIYTESSNMLAARRTHSGFEPEAEEQVLDIHKGVFAIVRTPSNSGSVVCVHEISGEHKTINLEKVTDLEKEAIDILNGVQVDPQAVHLSPYQSRWICRVEQ